MKKIRVENKMKISNMLMRYKQSVELEVDSIAALSAYLLAIGFEKDGAFEGIYTFYYYFTRNERRYCLSGNWFEGKIIFYKEN